MLNVPGAHKGFVYITFINFMKSHIFCQHLPFKFAVDLYYTIRLGAEISKRHTTEWKLGGDECQ